MSEPESENQQEPKIIVDTDWKEQVAREKEAAKEVEQDVSADANETDAGSVSGGAESQSGVESTPDAAESADGGEQELHPPPPATFDVLVSMLFTQAMAMLGQLPDPGSGETKVNKPYAKHYIDTLDMLSEKTKGNLSDDEAKMLSEALHALRMMYVNVKA